MKKQNSLYQLFVLIMVLPFCAFGQNNAIPVTVDPRVELISTVCRLAGYEEYNMASYPEYYRIVGEYFKPFENHEAVKLAKRIQEENSIGFNAPMGLAVYLKDIDKMETRVPFDQIPEDLDSRWNPTIVAEFLVALKDFARVSNFDSFMQSNQIIYDKATERFQEIIEKRDLVKWFGDYFGIAPDNDFKVILGLQNGGANYAARTTTKDGEKQIYSIIGCWEQDSLGLPVFHDGIIATVVHEFCHSYTNPIVDQFDQRLKSPAEEIFERIGDQMARMAYDNWKVMMYEYFVRACVVRYVALEHGDEAAGKLMERDIKRGFIGLDRFVDLLHKYEADRASYPVFTDFVPQITDLFESYSKQIDRDLALAEQQTKEKWNKLKTDGPQIIRMIPENGATDVSPDLEEIRIYFDREMNPSTYSVMYNPEDAELFPSQTGTPHYDKTNRIYIIPVKLEGEHTYKFSLNSFNSLGFQDKNGLGLYPVAVKFETGSK